MTVTGYAGKEIDGITTFFGDRWFIDRRVKTRKGYLINHMGEKQLKPIEEEDRNNVISWKEMKDIWVPDDLSVEI